MDLEYIQTKLSKIDILPTFPNVVGEVINVIEDPMSSASDLAKHMDPSMIGEVMRIANSAYFGTRSFRNITTVEHAIAVIGYKNLSYIILQMPFVTMVNKDDAVFESDTFVMHSLACGVLSKAISSATRRANPNEVYISGMVHDIGVVVMYKYFQNEWDKISALIKDKQMSRIEAELEVFSVDHGYIGAALLERWNIPKPITDAVMFHHCPEKATENIENVMVTALGNIFAKRIDLKKDLASFVDLMTAHRTFMEDIAVLKKEFSPNEEIRFFENVYASLKEVSNYIQGVAEGEHDKSNGS